MAQTAAAAAAADPTIDPLSEHMNISVFDLLLIELVPMAERLAREYEASLDRPSLTNKTTVVVTSNRSTTNTAAGAGATGTTVTESGSVKGGGGGGGASSVISTSSTTGGPTAAASGPTIPSTYDGLPETEVFKDSVYFRLERLGFRVGQGLSERFSRDRARFTDQLDVIKFLCKDLWMMVFKKQIDNLKTNHRGVYVLTDNKFRPFSRMSMTSNAEAVVRAQPHLIFPCGIIRGVLSSLGIKATVQAETSELPMAIFQIKTLQAKT